MLLVIFYMLLNVIKCFSPPSIRCVPKRLVMVQDLTSTALLLLLLPPCALTPDPLLDLLTLLLNLLSAYLPTLFNYLG